MTNIDTQCICERQIRQWDLVKVKSQMIRTTFGVLAGFGVMSIIASAPEKGDPTDYLIAGFLATLVTIYVSIFIGLRIVGHSAVCSLKLAWLRVIFHRRSLKTMSSEHGVTLHETQKPAPNRGKQIKHGERLAKITGWAAVMIGAVGLVANPASWLDSVELIFIGATAIISTVLPATKGKPFTKWPRAYQVLEILIIVLVVLQWELRK